ncbi:glucosaminidase domain-containing protein [Spiribacter halobius]|uniref:Mannosyl-glycoprotein endo-beta-N-acetylglucosamidase-like domain-containing protein n=1 Tax=Sediminicurvatus halobius TaxID=2182432 RepID=A0A2U2N151_9GAMM|nr:glucosaminidase domain-containing protein [Spiribacter halobius]PWG62975.1 hypothetical protein DEM34_10285 [Spiribacter halobius]UEX77490.1 glucosaminidase domain-containing protein [Spiribacter halobius]
MSSDARPRAAATPARVVVDALPLAVLVLVGLVWWLGGFGSARSDGPPLEPLRVDSAAELESVFARYGYEWPPDRVPGLALQRFPPDLDQVPVEQRKSLFLRSLLPLVLAENARIAAERDGLIAARDGELDDEDARRLVARLAGRYGVDGAPDDPATLEALLRRVDVVPPALALAQAANESGWGTSRFALEGNNLFGEWTWSEALGLEPENREEDAGHYVRRFPNLRASVASYLNNLNSHEAYADFRAQRAAMRAAGRPRRATALAEGLAAYSERGEEYIAELRTMLRQNGLADAITGVEILTTEQLAQR